MKEKKKYYPLKVIKILGIPNEAVTLDGIKVYRQDRIFVPELGRFILCAQYDNHFIYEEPTGKAGRSSFMCTCGAPAVIAGLSAYENDQSPSGLMFVCLLHSTYGRHSNTSSRRWV